MSQEGLEKKSLLLNCYLGSAYLLGQEDRGGTLCYDWLPHVVVYSGITNYSSIKILSDRNFSMGISPSVHYSSFHCFLDFWFDAKLHFVVSVPVHCGMTQS